MKDTMNDKNNKVVERVPAGSPEFKIFDLSRGKSLLVEQYLTFVLIAFSWIVLFVCVGLAFEYFRVKGPRMEPETLILSQISVGLLLCASGFGLYYLAKLVRAELSLYKTTNGKEIIFGGTKLSVAFGLIWSNHKIKFRRHRLAYLEIEYAAIKEVNILPAGHNGGSSIEFIMNDGDRSVLMRKNYLGSQEESFVNELKARISRALLL